MAIFEKYSPQWSRRYYSKGSSVQERRPDRIRQTGLCVCARHKWKERHAGQELDRATGVAAVNRQLRMAKWWWMSGPTQIRKLLLIVVFFPLWFVPKLIKRAAGNNVIEKKLEAIGKYNRKQLPIISPYNQSEGKCAEAGSCCLSMGTQCRAEGLWV